MHVYSLAQARMDHEVVFVLAGLPGIRHRLHHPTDVDTHRSQVLNEDVHRHLIRDYPGYDLEAEVWRPLQNKIPAMVRFKLEFN